jgi:hypothetical protein
MSGGCFLDDQRVIQIEDHCRDHGLDGSGRSARTGDRSTRRSMCGAHDGANQRRGAVVLDSRTSGRRGGRSAHVRVTKSRRCGLRRRSGVPRRRRPVRDFRAIASFLVRGFLLLAIAVCVAIGVGIAVEPAMAPSVPSVVEQAIAKTLAVHSLEIRVVESIESIRSYSGTGPAIYQAPDRWAGPLLNAPNDGVSRRNVVIGDAEYAVPVPDAGAGILGDLRQPVAHLHESDGMTPAQQLAFGPVLSAQFGTDFNRTAGGWTFHLDIVEGNIRETRGTIRLRDGYVGEANIAFVIRNGDSGELAFTYLQIDAAPAIALPV